jgi:hypothetical protein
MNPTHDSQSSTELDTLPLGGAIHTAGYLCLALAVIHAARQVIERLTAAITVDSTLLDWVNSTLHGLVEASPYLFLLPGLLAVARLGAAYQQGIVFTLANAHLIRRFGASLCLVAGTLIAIRPTLLQWITSADYSLSIRITDSSLAIVAAGLFVTAIAQVMTRATALHDENRQFV